MQVNTIIEILERDLKKLKEEISLYNNEASLWITEPGISNSAGNLTLHLIGNLNHFIGASLGNTGFIRARDKEFSRKNVPQQEILHEIDMTIETVKSSLSNLNESDLNKDFPLEMFGKKITTSWMLIHLISHLSYHLGQINYHRRLISG
jgi:hypothetical protein